MSTLAALIPAQQTAGPADVQADDSPAPETDTAEARSPEEGISDAAADDADQAREAAEDAEAAASAARDAAGPEEAISGADALKEAVAEQTPTVAAIVEQLDAVGFTVADTRISVWSVLVVILVLVGILLFARIAIRLGRNAVKRINRFDPAQSLLVDKLLSVVIWTFAILIGIDLLGVDLTALAVFSGAFGLALGFGLQKTFGNLLAGIILLMDRSIKPGDVISVTDSAGNESFGQIRKIGVRAISVVTRDRTEYLIPNEMLMTNQVVNWSYSSRDVRVKAAVGVSYNSDLELVEKLLYQAVDDVARVLKSPPPRVNIMEFGDSSVNLEVRFWIEDPEAGMANIRSDVYKRVWQLFQKNGVEIPFPQRDLNLRDNGQFQQLVAAITQKVESRER